MPGTAWAGALWCLRGVAGGRAKTGVRAGSGKAESTFSTLSAFWLRFGALLPGLGHGWFGVSTAEVAGTQEL